MLFFGWCLGWIVDGLLANCCWWLIGLVCSAILGFDAPRKEDGVQDNTAAKKRQASYYLLPLQLILSLYSRLGDFSELLLVRY